MRRMIISLAILIAVCALVSCNGGYSDSSSDDEDSESLDTSNAITAFGFTSANNSVLSADAAGVITGTDISVTVPYGTTSIANLIATFTTTGASVAIGTTEQTSGVTANDFTSAKTYTVTAADGSTQDYTVTVTVASASSKEITSFSFPAVTVPATSTYGTKISGTSITVTLIYVSTATSMVASFTTTGASVSVGGVVQTSGTTPNDFTSVKTYTVTAADGSTQDYTVTVNFPPAVNSAANIAAGGTLSDYWVTTASTSTDALDMYLGATCDSVYGDSHTYTAYLQLGSGGFCDFENLGARITKAGGTLDSSSTEINLIITAPSLSLLKTVMKIPTFTPPASPGQANFFIRLKDNNNGLRAFGLTEITVLARNE